MRISRQLTLGLIYSATVVFLAGCTATSPVKQPENLMPTNTPASEPTMQSQLSVDEARAIAENSECMEVGAISQESTYNPYSKTWWFNLKADKPGCSPACVVDESTQTATVNWRCTGALPPNQDTVTKEQ